MASYYVSNYQVSSIAAHQLAMGDAIRRIVSRKVVADHEKSLDILLGLICYLAWSVVSDRICFTYYN
jgi:hypothetical protein